MLHKFHLLGDIPREILETSSLWLPHGTMPRSGSSGRLPFSFAFKVWFKRIVGDATLGQVSLFLSCLSLLSTVLFWPLIVIFHYTRWEEFKWEDIPWKYLCGNAVLGMIFNFLINFGIAFTYPLFISLGTVLGIPINAVTDYLFRGAAFGSYKIVAAFSIVIGFLFMLLPKEFEETLQETFCCRKRERILN